MFAKLSLLWKVATIIAGVASLGGALWGAYAYAKHQGYVEGEAAATAKCQREKDAQEAANEDAIDQARRTAVRLDFELSRKESELDDAREALAAAAAADPDGARECLGTLSVQRLNAIR